MKKPIIAILGRPNVGKSTLFNRILQRRLAIVHDEPGVTRDCNYAEADWAGVEFDLFDTGGYIPGSDDVFDAAIRDQIDLAIKDADLILFLVDVTVGITSLDQEIANKLRRSGSRVVVAVNKVDNQEREMDAAEFHSLGLGEPVPLAALNGRNIGDFLDIVISHLSQEETEPDEKSGELMLAVLGRPNVGKSSYINGILGAEKQLVTEIPGTTRDAIDTSVRYNERDIVLVDTAGLRKKARVHESIEYFSVVRTINALRRCDVAIVLVDAASGMTDQDKKIIKMAIDEGKGVVIGVNKWDLIEKNTMTAREFELDMQRDLHDLNYLPILFISALTRQRIFRLLDSALAVFKERQRKVKTADLNQMLRDAVEEHHPPAFGTKWVKINYVTQVKSAPPRFVFFTNEPKGIRANYKKYLENQIRQRFGFYGVPIRMTFRQKS
ncbi:MAG: ribosome biogenesis GTPase Der [candidate division KSB1 bacterium]|nr:ribosome biogenesis GTPase Der [candidate division KSB1 bacterium]